MPTSATIHIQKIAPGPPRVSATATPAMLPVPTRLARLVQSAWNGEMPSLSRRPRADDDPEHLAEVQDLLEAQPDGEVDADRQQAVDQHVAPEDRVQEPNDGVHPANVSLCVPLRVDLQKHHFTSDGHRRQHLLVSARSGINAILSTL